MFTNVIQSLAEPHVTTFLIDKPTQPTALLFFSNVFEFESTYVHPSCKNDIPVITSFLVSIAVFF